MPWKCAIATSGSMRPIDSLACADLMFARIAHKHPLIGTYPMIGLVIVTHGRLAEEFLSAMEHVVGPQAQTSAICIAPDDDMERRRSDIMAAVSAVDRGDGVIVLTDMFGGTPSNLAISILDRPKVEVIAGVNLPMLIKLASVRLSCPLDQAVSAARDAGRKYISVASKVLSGEDA